ncbi:MAG: hypothetical protein IT373_27595 [Polyangiaceae bacterium]|nr:hypothetical protein [Polyangiaceae bacterium]
MPRAALVAFAGGALLSACVGVLGVGGYRDTVGELCGLLSDCYPGGIVACEQHLSQGLDTADAAEVGQWLAGFDGGLCLATCTAGKLCLDRPPVCGVAGDACQQLEHCCGFSQGASACEGGRCCAADGVTCTTAEECCSGSCSPVATGADVGGTGEVKLGCGGQSCQEFGATCTFDSDCCSFNCGPAGTCTITCFGEGEQCGAHGECCSDTCRAGHCACRGPQEACDTSDQCCSALCLDGLCVEPVNCLLAFDPCAPGGQPCCGDLACPSDLGYCCSAAGALCADPTGCCGGGCVGGACCALEGSSCVTDGDCCDGGCAAGTCGCAAVSTPCDSEKDCCSGSACYEASCQACVSAGCHDLCAPGAPLPADPNGVACPDITSLGCVADVCAALPHCCCNAWDAACVEAVGALGSNACGGIACAVPQ